MTNKKNPQRQAALEALAQAVAPQAPLDLERLNREDASKRQAACTKDIEAALAKHRCALKTQQVWIDGVPGNVAVIIVPQ